MIESEQKVKVPPSIFAVGAVGFGGPLYLGHRKRKAEPIPLLSLPYPSQVKNPLLIYCWVGRNSFLVVGLPSQGLNLRPAGDFFLVHN